MRETRSRGLPLKAYPGNLGPPPYTTRKTCRLCSGTTLVPLFNLGKQYVSDFVDYKDIHKGILCPISLVLCPTCTLVQLKHTAPQELLYSRHYWYRSGVTETMRNALRDITAAAEKLVELNPGDIVLDIGSNDGTLLKTYNKKLGCCLVGCEPADNLATSENYDRERKINLIHDFWSVEAYWKRLGVEHYEHQRESVKAKVITAIGMFYDLEDPNQFIADVAKVLSPDGVFIAQLMCLRNMLNVGDVGNLAHEHLEFYSLKSLDYLLNKHGLEIRDIETNKVNGESYRLYVRHQSGRAFDEGCNRVIAARRLEACLDQPQFYKSFYSDMESNKREAVFFIKDLVAEGKRVWVYGASTKGNVILQYYGLDRGVLEGAADRSPEKWGKYTIGSGIRITSEEEFRLANPDYALVLPYAFLPEFLERESQWRAGGGKFIVPLPKLKVV